MDPALFVYCLNSDKKRPMKKIKIENSNMENETVDGVTQIATWRPRRRR